MKSLPVQKADKSQRALRTGMGTGGNSTPPAMSLNCVLLPHGVGALRGDEITQHIPCPAVQLGHK